MFAGLLAFGWAGPAAAERVIVLAAASTAHVIDEVIGQFDAGPDDSVVASYAGTSALARQIESGAPADIFLAANEAWMDHVEAQGLIEPGSRQVLAGNRLVFVTSISDMAAFEPSATLDLPGLLDGGRLAIGNPDHVPAGIYARQALEALGLWPDVRSQLAPAADVRAALALVARGEAPLGIVYATDAARIEGMHVLGTIPALLHEPVVYPVVLIAGRASPLATRFFEFLTGPEGRAAFARAGFIVD
ncbi:MAG: molybdate ABC transporter substrate-binding protein [Chloroflexota bacterium]|nr:molybdate ABC transporter substrate-binding protein [Chloroflexota bacterium]